MTKECVNCEVYTPGAVPDINFPSVGERPAKGSGPVGFNPAGAGAVSTPTPSTPSPAPGSTFLGQSDNGMFIPPDSMGAVGLNYLMTVVNEQITIQDRIGSTLKSISSKSFWNDASGPFDQVFIYDKTSKRYFGTAVTFTGYTLLGVSRTEDPRGKWNIYRLKAPSASFPDFPRLGLSSSLVVVSIDLFGSTQFLRPVVYVTSKQSMIAGRRINVYVNNMTYYDFSVVPSTSIDNDTSSIYLTQISFISPVLKLWRIKANKPNRLEALSVPTIPTWARYNGAGNPQLDSGVLIDNNDSGILTNVYRNGKLYLSHHIFDASGQSGYQLEVFVPGSTNLSQVYSSPIGPTYASMPSAIVAKNGTILVGFTQFSSSIHPSAAYQLWVTGESVPRDPLIYVDGTGVYTKDFGSGRVRWGDYSASVVDPRDGSFWTIQEIAVDGNQWAIWWAHITV